MGGIFYFMIFFSFFFGGMYSSLDITLKKKTFFAWLLFLPSMTGEHCEVLHACVLHQKNQLLIKSLRFTNFQDFMVGIGTSIFGRRSPNMLLAVNRKETVCRIILG